MKRKRFSEEQIIGILKESEAGAKTKELCRKHGISDATFYIYGLLPKRNTWASKRLYRTNAYIYSASSADSSVPGWESRTRTPLQLAGPQWPI
jgi:putative transposase